MGLNQLKRALWVINELVKAGDEGISREKLNERWSRSEFNDTGRPELSERTFHRLRRELESLFQVEIQCHSRNVENRYRIELNEYSLFIGMLCRLVMDNSEFSISIRDLLHQVMSDVEITPEESAAIDKIAFKLNKTPFETGKKLIDAVLEGEVKGANRAQWGEYESHNVCIWEEDAYQRVMTWVGVNLPRKGKDGRGEIRFYIVNETQDFTLHEKLRKELHLKEGEKKGGDYWWFAPEEESFHLLGYTTTPDLSEIIRRVEILLMKLNNFAK